MSHGTVPISQNIINSKVHKHSILSNFQRAFNTVFDRCSREFFESRASEIYVEEIEDSSDKTTLKLVLLVSCSSPDKLEIAHPDCPISYYPEPKVSLQKLVLEMLYSEETKDYKDDYISLMMYSILKSQYRDLGAQVISRCLTLSHKYKKYHTAEKALNLTPCRVRLPYKSFYRIDTHLQNVVEDTSLYNLVDKTRFTFYKENTNLKVNSRPSCVTQEISSSYEGNTTSFGEFDVLGTDEEMLLLSLGLAYNNLTELQQKILADHLNCAEYMTVVNYYMTEYEEDFVATGKSFEQAFNEILNQLKIKVPEDITDDEANIFAEAFPNQCRKSIPGNG